MSKNIKIVILTGMSVLLSIHVHAMQDMQERSLKKLEQEMAKLFPQTEETELAAKALTSPSARNEYFRLLILRAIDERNVEKVQNTLKQALAQGFDIDSKDVADFTLLHEATCSANDIILQVLIGAGANVNSSNLVGNTPLYNAAINNNVEAVKQFIKAGADVTIKNKSNQSPLEYAVKHGSISVIRLLLEIPGITIDREELLKALDTSKNNVNIAPSIKQELDKILAPHLTTLVDLSADTVVKAIDKNCIKNKLHVLPQDLQEKVNDCLVQGLIDNELLEAIKTRNIPAALAALEQGACVNVKDTEFYGNTPLHWASLIDSPGLIQVLLSRGADSNKKATIGQLTPLHKAAMNGSLNALILLLEHGAQVNARAIMGNTPLHYAALCGQVNAAQLLLSYGADSNIVNNMGHTPFDIVNLRWVNISNKHILSQLLIPH